jgi:hypothetical protein
MYNSQRTILEAQSESPGFLAQRGEGAKDLLFFNQLKRSLRLGAFARDFPAASLGIVSALFLLGGAGGFAQGDLPPARSLNVDLYGNIFVVDGTQNTLTLLTKNRDTLRSVGGAGWKDSQFDRPAAVWAQNGIDVYVADYGNHRIQRFDRNLNFVSSFSTRDSEDPDIRFGYPMGVALSRLGALYICDSENSRILKVNSSNTVERSFGGFDAGLGRLMRPTQLACGPEDRVYVLDGPRVVVFDAFGNYLSRLYPELLKSPTSIFATPELVAVAAGTSVYCFDKEGSLRWNASASSLVGQDERIEGLCLVDDSILLMCKLGLRVLPLPAELDKERKTGYDKN